MKLIASDLPGVVIIEPAVFGDDRGWFYESFNEPRFAAGLAELGLPPAPRFVQDNHSCSKAGVLRGLHYQLPPQAQGKLVRVVQGAAWDVAGRHVGPLLAETGPASGASLPNVLIAKVGQVPLVVPRGPLGHVHLAVAGCGIMGRLLLCGGGRWRAGRRARLPASGKKRRGANSVDAGGGHEQGPAAGQGLQWPIA